MSPSTEIALELRRAVAARIAGNEGRMRVCARRAAGMAARDFLNRHDKYTPSLRRNLNPYEAIQALAAFPSLPPELRQAVVHLTMSVNSEFHLPPGIDLIDEANKIIQGLI
jgi:hypothetical protein